VRSDAVDVFHAGAAMTDKPISIGRRKTRLLCPDCDSLHTIEAHSDEQRMCILKCGHARTLGLLPSAPGTIGLEAIISNHPDAARWFPFVVSDNDRNETQEQQIREEWG
jgi:hypothetical protein